MAGILAVGFAVVRWLFPGDAARVSRLVQDAARVASWDSNRGGLDRLSGPGKLAGYCTPDVEVMLDLPGTATAVLRGSAEVREAAVAARTQVQALQAEISNLEVTLGPEPGLAKAQGMAVVRLSSSSEPLAFEVLITCRKMGRTWRIARVEPVKGLGL